MQCRSSFRMCLTWNTAERRWLVSEPGKRGVEDDRRLLRVNVGDESHGRDEIRKVARASRLTVLGDRDGLGSFGRLVWLQTKCAGAVADGWLVPIEAVGSDALMALA